VNGKDCRNVGRGITRVNGRGLKSNKKAKGMSKREKGGRKE
jgi:hypothetical protein